MKPGDIIVHSDSANDGQRNGGRISSLGGAGTAWTITFDTVLDWTPDLTKTYYIYFQNGQNDQNDAQLVIKGKVDAWFGPSSGYTSAQVVTTVALNDPVSGWSVPSTAFANIPYVISEEYQETLYRVERISEGQHPFEYEVTALRYSDDRFKKIDDGFIVGFSFDTNIPDTYTEDS
jgi:predicted phage tail protein